MVREFRLLSFFGTRRVLYRRFALLSDSLYRLEVSIKMIFVEGLRALIAGNGSIIRSLRPIGFVSFGASTAPCRQDVRISRDGADRAARPGGNANNGLTAIF